MTATALKIAIVSEDSDLLRETSWWLSAFGYSVQSLRNIEPLKSCWRRWRPEFLIVDADHPELEAAATLPQHSADHFTYRILLRSVDSRSQSSRDAEHAFNDVISKPLNHGEALARLRSGARFIELERLARCRAVRESSTGLWSRRGWMRSLQRRAVQGASNASFGVVLIGLDLWEMLQDSYGLAKCESYVATVAESISKLCGDSEIVGRYGQSDFAIARAGWSVEECQRFAVSLRDELIAQADDVSDDATPVTVTCCVGEWRSNGQPLADAMRDAERTLVHAKTMGGSTICNVGDFDAEFASWTQANVQSGVALAQLQARDVMTPFALTLSSDPDSEILAQALNSGVASIAQIDSDGKYAGLFDFGRLGNNRIEQAGGTPAPPTAVAEDASFAELIEKLTTDEQHVVVLSKEQSPLGYVSCAAMAQLLEPVYAETFREHEELLEDSAPLSVSAVAYSV